MLPVVHALPDDAGLRRGKAKVLAGDQWNKQELDPHP